MKTFLVVEGQGEEAAVPVVVRRIAGNLGKTFEVSGRPWRENRQRLLMREYLDPILQVGRRRSSAALIVLDADDDCAIEVAKRIREWAAVLSPGYPVRVVCPVREFEAWFLASAESLRGCRGLPADLARPDQPESIRDAKGWLSARMPRRYSPTLDQPALSGQFDLQECEQHSRSFRKFSKEVRALLSDT